eukprot:scaffold56689_cov60-Phaeocystis_antarctica.AAC.1
MPTATANDVLKLEILHARSELDRSRLEDCKTVRGYRGGVDPHAISKERHLALAATPPLVLPFHRECQGAPGSGQSAAQWAPRIPRIRAVVGRAGGEGGEGGNFGGGDGGDDGDGDGGENGGEGGDLGMFRRLSHVSVAGLNVLCGIHVLRPPHPIVFDSRAMGTPFRYSHHATLLLVRERWQQPPCIARSFDSAASAHLRFGCGPTLCVAASPTGCGVPVFTISSRSSLGSSTRPSDWRATDCMTAAAAVTSGLADDVPENLPVYASLSPLLP